jgi:hypothetical protein
VATKATTHRATVKKIPQKMMLHNNVSRRLARVSLVLSVLKGRMDMIGFYAQQSLFKKNDLK